MKIRNIKKDEMAKALDLVWRVFLKFEAPDYTEEGIQEFRKCLDNQDWLNKRDFYGYFDNKIIGVIATKDTSHIALFFVDENYHRQGIGKQLFSYVEKLNKQNYFTVNSSPYAHEVYKHLGFIDTDSEQQVNGLRFFPMRRDYDEK